MTLCQGQEKEIERTDPRSLKFLQIFYSGAEKVMLKLYEEQFGDTPKDMAWPIDKGPGTSLDLDGTSGLCFHFQVHRNRVPGDSRCYQTAVYEASCKVKVVKKFGKEGAIQILSATGYIQKYKIGDSDNVKCEQFTFPVCYNQHTRKGFALIPLFVSYRLGWAEIYDLNTD